VKLAQQSTHQSEFSAAYTPTELALSAEAAHRTVEAHEVHIVARVIAAYPRRILAGVVLLVLAMCGGMVGPIQNLQLDTGYR
jgi:hypothetical protein